MTTPLSQGRRPARTLRARPDLDQLKRQAKELLDAFLAGDADAVAEVRAHERRPDAATFALHDAQRVLARSYGFDSWPKLKAYVDGVTVKRLCDDVERGNLAGVREMLRRRPELVNFERGGVHGEQRALHVAVLRHDAPMVRLLMTHGADAHAGIHPYRDETTALTLAQERGWTDLVAIIEGEEEQQRRREAAGDANAPAPAHGESASATSKRDTSAPRPPDTPESDEWYDAIQRHDEARLAMLRQRGVELTARAAVALGEADWLRARHAEGRLVNPLDWATGGLLTLAVEHDRLDILTLLLDLAFDPNEPVRVENVEETIYSYAAPLWRAAARGNQAMAELLLARGANPNLHKLAAGSPVYGAYSHRQWAMVDLLERHGGIVGADIAGLYRETELARQMLAAERDGPLPEGTVTPGRTAAEELVQSGASGGDPEIVRMALERIDWPPDDERWYRTLTRPLTFWNHIPWLYAGNKAFDRGTYLTCFRLILERCGPHLRGPFGRTVLHEVAGSDRWLTPDERAAFGAALLDAGARLDVRDDLLRSTPLGWGCRWGYVEVVALLLAHGADRVEADAEPWATPTAWAAKKGHDAVLALLRARPGA